MNEERIIGIDLGTTNSCVAVLETDEPVVIPNAEGSRTTSSIVGFAAGGERLVGQVAKRQALTNPESTIFAVKRLMGRKFESEETEKQKELSPYSIIQASNGDAWVEIEGKQMSPPEISALILTHMKSVAEAYLGEDVKKAVITVPAYFDDAQRQATKDAGTIAGLEVERIINEPTAAALAYGLDSEGKQELIAVYDLGGGTFDISILEIDEGVFTVKATNGDTFLGGEDFDQRIVNFLIEKFKQESGIDLKEDRMALQRMKEAAEKAKHELSSSLETEIHLPFIAADQSGPKHLALTLTRRQFEEMVEDLIDRTFDSCKQALDDGELNADQVNQVLLVGGMTRMPLVQRKVGEFFGREPHKGINPDEVVSVGAAVQGGVLAGTMEEVLLLDVTPLSLGVETAGGVFTKIIYRNTTIPTRQSEIFTTSMDNQDFVPIHVLQGEREMCADNKTLARFELTGIPPAPRGVPQIKVTFDIDANGIVHVSARDLGTGREQSIRVTASSGLTEDDISHILNDAEAYKNEDVKRKELAEIRNMAQSLLYTSEKALTEYGEMLEAIDREIIRSDIEALRLAVETIDAEQIRELCQKLEASVYRIADKIYGAVPDEESGTESVPPDGVDEDYDYDEEDDEDYEDDDDDYSSEDDGA